MRGIRFYDFGVNSLDHAGWITKCVFKWATHIAHEWLRLILECIEDGVGNAQYYCQK
jgi:hypothetical protein